MPEEPPTEKGSWFDLEAAFNVNEQAEPIMRSWQLSEALNRMARRMKKRYPEQARVLERASVDICFEFYKSMSEAQKKALERMKEKQNLEIASQIEGRLRRAREEMQAGATAVSNAIHSTSSTQTVSASGEMGC